MAAPFPTLPFTWSAPCPFDLHNVATADGSPKLIPGQDEVLKAVFRDLADTSKHPPDTHIHVALNAMNCRSLIVNNIPWIYFHPVTAMPHSATPNVGTIGIHPSVTSDFSVPWTPVANAVARNNGPMNLPRYRLCVFIHKHRGVSSARDVYSVAMWDSDSGALSWHDIGVDLLGQPQRIAEAQNCWNNVETNFPPGSGPNPAAPTIETSYNILAGLYPCARSRVPQHRSIFQVMAWSIEVLVGVAQGAPLSGPFGNDMYTSAGLNSPWGLAYISGGMKLLDDVLVVSTPKNRFIKDTDGESLKSWVGGESWDSNGDNWQIGGYDGGNRELD